MVPSVFFFFLFFTIIDMPTVAIAVMKTKNNTGVMQSLLKEAATALHQGRYNHLGSSSLWAHHMQAVVRMQKRLDSIQLDEVSVAVWMRSV